MIRRSSSLWPWGLLLSAQAVSAQGSFVNPNPADTAVGVGLRPALTWTGPAGTQSYGVRLSSAREALTSTSLASTGEGRFPVTTGLEPGTTYYWQVVANEASPAAAYGPVWTFTTGGEQRMSWWARLRSVLGLSTLALAFAWLVKWVVDRSNRATDVLLGLEKQFGETREGRKQIEYDDLYDGKKVSLLKGRTSGGDLEDIDALLRFYVVLFAVRQARQVPDRSLRTAYRYWLAHYYLTDRAEFRHYVNTFFPTLRRWLQSDLQWQTRRQTPWTFYRAPFFRPGDFWAAEQFIAQRALLDSPPPKSPHHHRRRHLR